MKVASINLLGMCALVGSAEITFVSALTQQLFFAQLWELTWRFFVDPVNRVNRGNRDKRASTISAIAGRDRVCGPRTIKRPPIQVASDLLGLRD